MFGRKKVVEFDVHIAKQASRYINNSGDKIGPQIEKGIGNIQRNPYKEGYPLKGELEGYYACISGKFRIIYHIDDINNLIEIVRIGPRGDIYKK